MFDPAKTESAAARAIHDQMRFLERQWGRLPAGIEALVNEACAVIERQQKTITDLAWRTAAAPMIVKGVDQESDPKTEHVQVSFRPWGKLRSSSQAHKLLSAEPNFSGKSAHAIIVDDLEVDECDDPPQIMGVDFGCWAGDQSTSVIGRLIDGKLHIEDLQTMADAEAVDAVNAEALRIVSGDSGWTIHPDRISATALSGMGSTGAAAKQHGDAPEPEKVAVAGACPGCGHHRLNTCKMKLPGFVLAAFPSCSRCGWSGQPEEAS